MTRRVVLVLADPGATTQLIEALDPLDDAWQVLDAAGNCLPWPSSVGQQVFETIIGQTTDNLVVLLAPDRPWYQQLHDVLTRSAAFERVDLTTHDSPADELIRLIGSPPSQSQHDPQTSTPIEVAPAAVREVLARAFTRLGVSERDANLAAEDLVSAELTGYASHGIRRATEYIDKLRKGIYRPDGRPAHTHLAAGRTTVDGDHALGSVVWRHVVDEVIYPSTEPVHVIGVRHAGHLGRLARLGEEIAGHDRLVIGFANGAGGAQKVAPHGGAEARLATNPILFACPMPGGPALVVDISTSAWSEGRVREAFAASQTVPSGVLHDVKGRSVTAAGRFIALPPLAALSPLGATESHKGFGLSLATEILAGVLGGPDFVRPGRLSFGNSLLLLVLKLDALGRSPDAVKEDLGRMAAYICSCPPSSPGQPVRLPGARPYDSNAALQIEASRWQELLALAGLPEYVADRGTV